MVRDIIVGVHGAERETRIERNHIKPAVTRGNISQYAALLQVSGVQSRGIIRQMDRDSGEASRAGADRGPNIDVRGSYKDREGRAAHAGSNDASSGVR